MRSAAQAAFLHRWTGILAVAAQRAFAATLLELPVDDAGGVDGDVPVLEGSWATHDCWRRPSPVASPEVPSARSRHIVRRGLQRIGEEGHLDSE